MKIFKTYILSSLIFLSFLDAFAQKKDENIGSEVVNIVKPYTPSISDAFKIKEVPSFEDDESLEKKPINYNIFSFPVASTFVPAKGKAADADKKEKEKYFANYATLAGGNYGTINAELFLTHNIDRTSYIGALLRHVSTQGGIKNLDLDDKFYNTSADVTYGVREKEYNWNVDLGFKNQILNWYGLPTDNIFYSDVTINAIDEAQTYNTISLGGRFALDNSIFKQASLQFIRFSDAFSSGENRVVAKPEIAIDVMEQNIQIPFLLDYVAGKFETEYSNTSEIQYSTAIAAARPSINFIKDKFSAQIGAGIYYGATTLNNADNNKVFIYPDVNFSYNLMSDALIGYAGANGSLQQNTYQNLTTQNLFVSPTLLISPTDNKYNFYAGLKGKLSSNVGFNIKGAFSQDEGKPLFISQPFYLSNTNINGYAYANSFNVVYDNVKTISFTGEIKADFSKNISAGLNATFNSFSTEFEEEAWNLPQFLITTSVDADITPKWYAGFQVFFVGERKDFITIQDDVFINPGTFSQKTITLDSYLDANAHLAYKYNNRLTAFLKGNNLANQQYTKWANYPVQGIQVLLGASYKFDF